MHLNIFHHTKFVRRYAENFAVAPSKEEHDKTLAFAMHELEKKNDLVLIIEIEFHVKIIMFKLWKWQTMAYADNKNDNW